MFSLAAALRLPGKAGRVQWAAQWRRQGQPLHVLSRLGAGRVGRPGLKLGTAARVPPGALRRAPCRPIITTVGKYKKVIHLGSKGLAHDEVALREGGLLFRIHHGLRANLDTSALFWLSKGAMLVSCFALDWTMLRSVLIAESLITMTMHAAWTRPRFARMGLSVVLACGHCLSLWVYSRQHAYKGFDIIFGPSLTEHPSSVPPHASCSTWGSCGYCRMRCALLGGRTDRMLIGACNPIAIRPYRQFTSPGTTTWGSTKRSTNARSSRSGSPSTTSRR